MNHKLQAGDEIRVLAPSGGWKTGRVKSYERARRVLEELGYKVSFSRNIRSSARFDTGTVADRVADLHEAYRDPAVKLVMALHGGWSANALLSEIDWSLVAANPKPFIGFSDLTVLVNALYAKNGAVQYLGPTFSALSHPATLAYTLENLQTILRGDAPALLKRSQSWERQRRTKLAKTRPWKVLQPGTGEGVLIGGNLGSFYLLQGTSCQPRFDRPTILVVEDDDEAGSNSAREFDRRLESLLQLPGLRKNLQGVVIGRFQTSSDVTMPDIAYVVQRLGLGDIPVIADVDFGHTAPMLTLPIGGTARLTTENNRAQVNLLKW